MITYSDKQIFEYKPQVPNVNKVTAEDMNEIKQNVNALATRDYRTIIVETDGINSGYNIAHLIQMPYVVGLEAIGETQYPFKIISKVNNSLEIDFYDTLPPVANLIFDLKVDKV